MGKSYKTPTPDDKIVAPRKNGNANKLNINDKQFHDWYRFVLSFPPHLVRDYFIRFGLKHGDTVLDPFCGTGTTVVEAKLHGVSSIGIEANTMAHFASSVKVDWSVDPHGLLDNAISVASRAHKIIATESTSSLRKLPEEAFSLLLRDSISPLPLHKSLVLLDQIKNNPEQQFLNHELLALAKALVFSISNLHFGPEVGVLRTKKTDAPVVERWLSEIKSMCADLQAARNQTTPAVIHHADSRDLAQLLQPQSIDAVFTSPPYPNEKDYTRTTRLESVILGFINSKDELRALKKGLLRSNTRNVYKGDTDDECVSQHEEIQAIAGTIEKRRIELNKTSGFEKLYGRVTKLYFGGMARHLATIRPFLKPGAHLGYVVGDQASYFQVMIKTGNILADIAKSLGYGVVGIDLFRTRLATATKKQMREEVLVLRWVQ
jgi:16S rRNA G966 N2-methylase RsmD